MDDDYRIVLERKLVHHCTPTLAGLKPANLFTCRKEQTEEAFCDALAAARRKLAPLGVRIEVLTRRAMGTLLYVYRPELVEEALNRRPAAAYLAEEGYDVASLGACIERLRARICAADVQSRLSGACAFPHEIGLFLGYPFDDVMGFISNKGENYLCCGCWKVYSRARDAQECFCRYKACTALYESLYDGGTPIERLAAVASDPAAAAELAASLAQLRQAG